ncbi:formylglycine-generating enzyme family protein [Naasia sp. SYSU D00057]|uniref:formylglycine-generating enzyme family protein n=1 Tax=Naasia sp. SYSU D00057 TaxID=2817380 RepID=UPI0024A73842|nr:formylglycine-generating enzyme family protein [Naasia sp. SYSU D00057]
MPDSPMRQEPPEAERSNAPDNHSAPGSCCAPARGSGFGGGSAPAEPSTGTARHSIEQVDLPGGVFLMGDASGDGNRMDGETPVHEVELAPFRIDATSVTNAAFAEFAETTGYATEAEAFGYSAVFHLAVAAPPADVMGSAAGAPWWFGVRGADWRHPGGRDSGIDGIEDHPVVHVSWNDAVAYCAWAGRRLPTEAEWEYASRGGREGARYPWGDGLMAGDESWRVNIFQGRFPAANTTEDGWPTTAPVRTFEPNGFGLWQTVGNVWEWCSDWFDAGYYDASPRVDPAGPESGQARILRGGSYLCHSSYCNRYRNSARSSNTPDSSMGNAGFRTVALA